MFKRLFIRAFMFFTILTLFLCGFLSSARAQTWVDLELYGGQIYDIAIDPSNTNHMFAGGYLGGGLYSTTNGGTNWQAVLTGEEGGGYEGEATFRNHAVWAVKIAPSNNSHVWAVHNSWAEKSTDGGANWSHILNSTMQGSQFRFCRSVAIHPSDPQTIYVGTGGQNGSYLNGAIYKTINGGTSWTKIGPGGGDFDYTVVDIGIDSINNNIVWVITSDFNAAGEYSSIYRSTNGGTNWTYFGTTNSTMYDLVVRPDVGNQIFIAEKYGIYKFWYHYVSGWVWTYDKVHSSSSNARALAITSGSPYSLFAAWGGTYLSKSDDWGSTWTDYTADKQFISLEVHPSNSNVIYGGELHLGVYRGVYSSGNYTWTPYKNGVTSIMVWDIAIDPDDSTHYLAATEAGVYEKQGTGWTKISSFLYSSAYSVAFDPTSASTYYAGTEGRFYKKVGSGSWTSHTLSDGGRVNDIAIYPDLEDPDYHIIFVTTRSSGRVYKSINAGSSFSNITPSGASFDFGAVAIDPIDSSHIFVGGGNYFAPKQLGNLYESTNGGTNWTTSLANVIVNALLIDPDNTNIIYAGCGYSGGTEVPLYKSTNGGSTWVKSYEGIPGEPTRYGIWGSSASNFWVLRHNGSVVKGGGDDTEILYYNGNWSLVDIGVSTPLYDIWGSSWENIFAVGNSGTIVRYNGTAWTERVSGTTEDLLGVWSSGSTVFAVGENGTTRRSTNNGFTWSSLTSETTKDLCGVWGANGSNVFAVGSYGTILFFNGSSWSAMESGVTTHLEGVWGSSSSDVFAVGDPWFDGSDLHFTILHWNDTNWQIMTTPAVPGGKSGKLHGVWGTSASNVYAVGEDGVILRYNGSSWLLQTIDPADHLYGVWGTASNNVYAVGSYGTIRHYTTGPGWTPRTVTGLPNNRNEYANNWNAVTDIKFKDETGLDGGSNRNIYASTDLQGVYFSPNQAGIWFNLGAPGYTVFAIDTGSIVLGLAGAANGGGNFGWIYGYVRDDVTELGILKATVTATNYDDCTESADSDKYGYYFIHDLLAGNATGSHYYDVTAVKEGYDTESTTEYYSSPPAYVVAAYCLSVDFYLHDPLITVTINGQEVEAQGGIFQTDEGSITPTGDIKWSMPPDNGLLMVQYQGSATLTIAPAPGYEVQDVLVDDASIGPQTQYIFENMVADREIEVIFILADNLPDAVNDTASTPEDTTIIINVLTNDDLGDEPTTITAVTQGSNGAVTFTTTTVTYTPNANFNGSDNFTYTITDNDGDTDTATVTVTVSAADNLPDAVNDTASTPEDTTIIINVLTNDDLGDEPTTITAVTQGSNGTVTNNTTTVTYTPNANFNGSDNFTYTITDNDGDTDTATVTVTVSAADDLPDAINDTASTPEYTPIIISVLTNDDLGDEPTTITAVTQGSNGAVTFTTTTVTYSPNTDFNGSDSFTYTITDNDGDTDTATITVTVTNDSPVAVADNYTVAEGGTLNQAAPGVLENDTDAENDPLTAVLDSGPSHATSFTMNADGSFTYTHDGGEDTSDSFTYHANDGSNDSNIATVTITITEVIVEVNPHHNAGVDPDTTRVPNNTSFAVRIKDSNGIDTTDIESITFTIDDSDNVPPYEYNLGNSDVVRVVKLDPNEDNAHVTKLWAVYDRSKDDTYGNVYSFEATITISVAIKDTQNGMAEGVYCFKVETQQQHDDAIGNLPDIGPVDPADPALGGDYDAGSQVNSGDLEGAKIVYDNSEPVTPTLGPTGELPPFDVTDSDAVGAPMNLQPPTVFNTPIKIFIPCPGHTDVSNLSVYRYNGTSWVLACDASGTVQPGGEGWMVPGSRVNHNNGSPSTIEIQVYHFTGVQGASSTIPPSPPPPASGGGGGGGGCFIATAAYGSHMERHVKVLREFRDRFLLTTPVGRVFVDIYSTYSPLMADFIASHDTVRLVVRWSLLPLVGMSWVAINSGLLAALIFMLLFGFGLVHLIGVRRKLSK